METENKTGTTEALITNNGFLTYVSIVSIALADFIVLIIRGSVEQTPTQAFVTCIIALLGSMMVTTRIIVPITLLFFDNMGVRHYHGVPNLPPGSIPPPPRGGSGQSMGPIGGISIKIDGVDVTGQYTNSENGPNSDIVIQGPVVKLETSASVTVNGSVTNGVQAGGSVRVEQGVSGGIKADGTVTVTGNVSGGINVDGNVTVNGNNNGDIAGENVYIGLKNSGSIDAGGNVKSKDGVGGDIKADGNIELERSVDGNVSSESGNVYINAAAVVGGHVKADGNIRVYGSVLGSVESENGEVSVKKRG